MSERGRGKGKGGHSRRGSRSSRSFRGRQSGEQLEEEGGREEEELTPFDTNAYSEALALSSDSSDSKADDSPTILSSGSGVGASSAGARARRNSYTRRDHFQRLEAEELAWMVGSAGAVMALVVGAVVVVVLG